MKAASVKRSFPTFWMRSLLWLAVVFLVMVLWACCVSANPDGQPADSGPSANASLAEPLELSSTAPLPPDISTGTPTAIPPAATPTDVILPPTASPSPQSSPTATPFPATPTPLACWGLGGQVKQLSLETDLLPEPLEFHVYLPPCYDQQPERRYPVLYLVHGKGSTDDQWVRLGADKIADSLILSGDAAPFIIVMPRDRVWLRPTRDKFGDAVIHTLVPWVDENLHTLSERKYRSIGGLSRGAAWALHLGLIHWDLFGAIGCHSLPVFRQDIPYLVSWLNGIPIEEQPRFYIDVGDHDRDEALYNSAQSFEDLLTKQNIPHEFHRYPGYHDEEYWGAHIEDYLRFYTADW